MPEVPRTLRKRMVRRARLFKMQEYPRLARRPRHQYVCVEPAVMHTRQAAITPTFMSWQRMIFEHCRRPESSPNKKGITHE